MAKSPQNDSEPFNRWMAQMTSGFLQNLTVYDSRRQQRELCVCCRVILRKASSFFDQKVLPDSFITFDHYPQFEFLLESSRTCGLCYLFMYSLRHEKGDMRISYTDFPNALLELSAMRRLKDMDTSMTIWFEDECSSGKAILPDSRQFRILCGIFEEPQWNGTSICWLPVADILKVPSVKAYYVEAQATKKTVLDWINYCNKNHSVCGKYCCQKEKQILPSRVIDVGAPGSLSVPYLFISNGQRAPYTCLSHCWGGSASTVIKTTKENLEARKAQIPLADLPRTFQDAVRITRDMNIRYLWIDSLCIVQNDIDDWQNEAAMMASIYKNSYLTIAATASKDSNGGCFRPRKPFTLVPRPPFELSQFSHPSELLFLYPDSMRTLEYMLDAPLNRRGWVFQELFLSCRTLNFCEDQLLWHCLERIVTEDSVVDISGLDKDYKSKDRLFSMLGTKFGLIGDYHNIELRRIYWWNIVREFTSRNLTRITDRLPALSGVISEIQERTGDPPIAGLWINDLPYGLLWKCASRSMKKPQDLSRIPTWSWIALDGPIQHHERRTSIEVQVEIITAKVYHSGLVPTSPITGGTLSLYGRVQLATRSRDDKTFGIYVEVGDEDISYFRLLTPDPSSDPDIKGCHIGICVFDQEAPPLNQALWCLEISISEMESKKFDPFEGVDAPARTHDVLILEPIDNSDEIFRRIGVGVIHVNTETFKREKLLVSII